MEFQIGEKAMVVGIDPSMFHMLNLTTGQMTDGSFLNGEIVEITRTLGFCPGCVMTGDTPMEPTYGVRFSELLELCLEPRFLRKLPGEDFPRMKLEYVSHPNTVTKWNLCPWWPEALVKEQ